jgi:hypothetical protein
MTKRRLTTKPVLTEVRGKALSETPAQGVINYSTTTTPQLGRKRLPVSKRNIKLLRGLCTQKQAAMILNVSVSTLKRRNREWFKSRWPNNKHKSRSSSGVRKRKGSKAKRMGSVLKSSDNTQDVTPMVIRKSMLPVDELLNTKNVTPLYLNADAVSMWKVYDMMIKKDKYYH